MHGEGRGDIQRGRARPRLVQLAISATVDMRELAGGATIDMTETEFSSSHLPQVIKPRAPLLKSFLPQAWHFLQYLKPHSD